MLLTLVMAHVGLLMLGFTRHRKDTFQERLMISTSCLPQIC